VKFTNANMWVINFSEVKMSFLLRYPDGTREQLVIPASAQIRVRIVLCACVCVCLCVRTHAHVCLFVHVYIIYKI
jgi:hypothetical protein